MPARYQYQPPYTYPSLGALRLSAIVLRMKLQHDTDVQRVGPGAYRAICTADGWEGEVRENVRGRWAKRAALADADVHAGRVPEQIGTAPNRPMRIPDALWNAVLAVAEDEGLTASEIWRQAGAADPRIAAKLNSISA